MIRRIQIIAQNVLWVLALIILGAWLDRPIADKQWEQRIEQCAQADEYGNPVPVYEDSMGNAYYVDRQTRNMTMIPREGLAR